MITICHCECARTGEKNRWEAEELKRVMKQDQIPSDELSNLVSSGLGMAMRDRYCEEVCRVRKFYERYADK